jgi:cellulose biosynthesis protein BcsQ
VALVDADDQGTASRWLRSVADHRVAVGELKSADDNERADELAGRIKKLASTHDFVVVDTKGSATLSTSAAVIKSDFVFIPLQASATDIWPIEKALSVIRLSRKARNGLPAASLILNLTDDRDVVARDIRMLAARHEIAVAETNVKRLNAYRDAPGNRTVATRLANERGILAGQRLGVLFEEILGEHLGPKCRRVANE